MAAQQPPRPAMNYYKTISGSCASILTCRKATGNPHAMALVNAKQTVGGEILCFVIMAPKTGIYWAAMLKMLCWGMNLRRHTFEVAAGTVISFLYGFLADPKSALASLGKHHGIKIRIMELTINHGTLVGKSDEDSDYLDSIDGQSTIDHSAYFQGGPDMTDIDDCAATEVSYITVLHHMLQIAVKAVTSPNNCITTAETRINNTAQSLPTDLTFMLSQEGAERMMLIISRSMPVRRAMVSLCIASGQHDNQGSNAFTVIHHAAGYLAGTGLTGFTVVSRYLIASESPILALPMLKAQTDHMYGLLQDYASRQSDAPYIKFLSARGADKYNPSHFESLYHAALGAASHIEPSLAAYTPGEQAAQSKFYALGKEMSRSSMPTPTSDVAVGLGITQDQLVMLEKVMERVNEHLPADDHREANTLYNLFNTPNPEGYRFL